MPLPTLVAEAQALYDASLDRSGIPFFFFCAHVTLEAHANDRNILFARKARLFFARRNPLWARSVCARISIVKTIWFVIIGAAITGRVLQVLRRVLDWIEWLHGRDIKERWGKIEREFREIMEGGSKVVPPHQAAESCP